MPTTFALDQLSVLAINLFQEDTSSDFQDLGKWLLGGFAAAIVVAIALTLIKLRLQEKRPPTRIISIKPGD